MIHRFKDISGHFRFFSVFLLIASFLVLGSCPLKKAIQVLLYGSAQVEHTGTGNGKSLASVLCVGGESSLGKKMFLPARQAETNATLLVGILFIAVWAIWSVWRSGSQSLSFRESDSLAIYPVPIYLRNRIFRI